LEGLKLVSVTGSQRFSVVLLGSLNRNGLLARLGRPLLRLGKIWERYRLSRAFHWPARTEKLTELFSSDTLVLRKGVRVIFSHTVPAVTEPLLANLLRDSQRVHRRRVRVAEAVQAQRACPFLTASRCVDGPILADNLGKELEVNLRNIKTTECLVQLSNEDVAGIPRTARRGLEQEAVRPTGQVFLYQRAE
jgi:hypothetical protein